MNTAQILTLIAAIGGPISGILIAILSNSRSKKQVGEEQTVARAAVRVDEKDAHTREIAVILDGYTAVNTALNKSLERAETGLTDCSEKYDALERRFEESEQRARERERYEAALRLDLIEHIQALEALVPSPPGPPERPTWGRGKEEI